MRNTTKILKTVKCCTVGDLLDALAEIARDPALQSVLDAQLEGEGSSFDGFRVVENTLSDKSKVLDFELFED